MSVPCGCAGGFDLPELKEHGGLFTAESRKTGAAEETGLTRDREEFLYPSVAGPLFAEVDQLGRDSTLLEIRMHRQAAHFRQTLGINLKSATADDPVRCRSHQER